MANVSRRVVRGRVHWIGFDGVGSKSVQDGCLGRNDSLDPCKFIVGSHDT